MSLSDKIPPEKFNMCIRPGLGRVYEKQTRLLRQFKKITNSFLLFINRTVFPFMTINIKRFVQLIRLSFLFHNHNRLGFCLMKTSGFI